MTKLNNNKLQANRNFKSIWHSHPNNIAQYLREDQLLREYIIGTMKAQEWNISEIIIKRKVKHIHIAFQIQKKKLKERKRWTKNRLRSRRQYREKMKLRNLNKKKKIKSQNKSYLKSRQLFFQVFLMIAELRKMFPNNLITFYVQKTKPLQYNSNLVNSWIISNFKKKKSYKRLINKIIWKFKKGIQKTNLPYKTVEKTWNNLKPNDRKNFISWITANLTYIFKVQNSFNNIDSPLIDILNNNVKPKKSSWKFYTRKKSKRFNKGGILLNYMKEKQNYFKLYLKKKTLNKFTPVNNNFKPKNNYNKLQKNNYHFKPLISRNVERYNHILLKLKNKLNPSRKNTLTHSKLRGQLLKNNSIKIKRNKKVLTKKLLSKEQFNDFSEYKNKFLKNISPEISEIPAISPQVPAAEKIIIKNNTLEKKIKPFNPLKNHNILKIKKLKFNINNKYDLKIKAILKSKSIILTNNNILNQKLKYLKQENKILNIQKNMMKNRLLLNPAGAYLSGSKLNMPNKDKYILKNKLKNQLVIKYKFINKLKYFKKNNNIENKIIKDLRSIWKLNKKNCLEWKHNNNKFKEESKFLLNYYKLKYLSLKVLKSYNKENDYLKDTINFLWQGKNFIKFLKKHPILFDHIINCLISLPKLTKDYPSKEDQLIVFLTHIWMGFFDYIYHVQNTIRKYRGIKIMLSGRIGWRKMGRAKKYAKSWGIYQNSSARLPLQYTYSQIFTRYGVIGMKIFMR